MTSSSPRTAAYSVVNYDQTSEKLDASARERLEGRDRGAGEVRGRRRDVRRADRRRRHRRLPIGEVIGLVIAIVLLIAVLRSLRAAGNALLAAFAGLGLGFGALMWAAAATEVPGLAPTLAGMLGLGAGIDYALLLLPRQREELRAGHDPVEAAKRANATAGRSAVTAAGIVLTMEISSLLVTGIPFVGRAGVAAGLVNARLRRDVRRAAARALRPLRPPAAAAQGAPGADRRRPAPCVRRGRPAGPASR